MTSNNDQQDFLDIVPDPTVKQILRKQINEVAFNDEKFNKKLQKTKPSDNQLNVIDRPINIRYEDENNQNDNQDYQAELNPYKRDRAYEFIEPQKFKKIGYTLGGAVRKPVFRMTDLYLPSSDRVEKIIDRIFKDKIFGKSRQVIHSQGLQSQFDNTERLLQIYNQWQTKQDFDEFQNAKNDLNQKDLEQIVVNMGDKKQNFFLLIKHQKQKRRTEQYLKKQIKNLPINNTRFLRNFNKAVTQLAQKNKIIQQFQSQSDQDEGTFQKQQKLSFGQSSNGRSFSDKKSSNLAEQQNLSKQLFGSMKFSSQKSSKISKILKSYEQSTQNNSDPSLFPTVQQNIALDIKHKYQKSFNQELIKYYSYSNNEIVNDAHKGPLQSLNRIEYHLANPDFFLPKLHIALERQHDFSKVKGHDAMKQQQGLFGKGNWNNLSQLNKSKISDSLFAGNRQAQFSKPSMIEGSGQQNLPFLQDDQQTIQKRIDMQLRNIYKEPLHHSQVALKFDLVRFTLDQDEFSSFHRYQFPYSYYFKSKQTIKPIFSKSRKIRPKDLIINTEMKNSNIKYSKQQSLSLAQGQFILVQYIQEHPLAMSSIGMCQRMFIQVNYQQMLEKINQDLIKTAQIQDFEDLRDNSGRGGNANNNFERKCQLWRQNIKQTFGQNGKLFLWEPKMAGKLIGTPEGLGVGAMESNLATYPIVKKKIDPKSRDFLLVRQDGKWYIRRIQHMYVSGQVEPKKKIFNPDSRQYILFKTNYQKAFMRRQISIYGNVNFDHIKRTFSGQSEASLKKALKSIRATSNDNKNYTILDDNYQYELTTEDVCLYERMQKSICLLKQLNITQIRNNQKMKNVLKQFNKRHIQSLQKFTISRMIKDQLLLTSWYLTDSFSKFKIKASKIQIVGMADPTNGRGGYSFINKPQKERTAREDMEEKNQKPKVSGTTSDLRKLKTGITREFLISRGHKQEQLKGKGRWDLVGLARKQQNTQFSRKQRETKPQKAENEKRQISRVFNKMLAYLNSQQPSPIFNYNFKKKITLQELTQKEKLVWIKTRDRILKGEKQESQEVSSDDDDDFSDDDEGNQ